MVCYLVFGLTWWVVLSLLVALCMGWVLRVVVSPSNSPFNSPFNELAEGAEGASKGRPAAEPAPDAASAAAPVPTAGEDVGEDAVTVPGLRAATGASSGAPPRRRRLSTVIADGERVPLYESSASGRGRSFHGLVVLAGFAGAGGVAGGRLTDLSTLRETWVVPPRHWMN